MIFPRTIKHFCHRLIHDFACSLHVFFAWLEFFFFFKKKTEGLCEKDTIECYKNKAIKSFITQSSDAFSMINRCFIDISALKILFLFSLESPNQKFQSTFAILIIFFVLHENGEYKIFFIMRRRKNFVLAIKFHILREKKIVDKY